MFVILPLWERNAQKISQKKQQKLYRLWAAEDIKFMVRMRSLDVVNFLLLYSFSVLVGYFFSIYKSEKFREKDYKVKCIQPA